MGERICSVDGCGKRAHARGWCGMHYRRWLTHGSIDDPPQPSPICSVEGCDGPASKRGWCPRHYSRWRRNGDPQKGRDDLPKGSSIEDRFWAKVDKKGPVPAAPDLDRCWLWTASLRVDGYGQFRIDGRTRAAHQVSYELQVGDVPDGLVLDHLCRNHICVNPSHLEPVTQQENILRGVSPPASHVRKTHCPNGHPYDDMNTGPAKRPNGIIGRRCRACHRDDERERAGRRKVS